MIDVAIALGITLMAITISYVITLWARHKWEDQDR